MPCLENTSTFKLRLDLVETHCIAAHTHTCTHTHTHTRLFLQPEAENHLVKMPGVKPMKIKP